MTVLVLAGNFLLMFVGWEGVGLASYLLIGFYFQRNSAAAAGKKAFIVNRIGDFGFLIGIFLVLSTLRHAHLRRNRGHSRATTRMDTATVLTVICLCLLVGAAGKSAQLPLYIWLPDAMEGPTPVSALIHAATMVTAGVYMIARTHLLFDRAPIALWTVAIVGAATALFAATIALVQTDIKRVLAYSTISQLGYMFLGLRRRGLLGGHLPSRHARLLQGAALPRRRLRHSRPGRRAGPAQDGRPAQETSRHFLDHDRGRLRHRRIPALRRLLLQRRNPLRRISAWNRRQAPLVRRPGHGAAHIVLHVSPLVHGLHRRAAQRDAHPHESPWSMLVPLVILAMLSVCGGWIGIERFSAYLAPAAQAHRPMPTGNPALELILSIVAVLVALEGWLIADKYYRRKTERPAQLAAALPAAYKLLVEQVLRRRNLRRGHRQAAVRFLKIRSRLGRRHRNPRRRCLASRRHRQHLRNDSAALAIGQSALLRRVAGRWRRSRASIPAAHRSPHAWSLPSSCRNHLQSESHCRDSNGQAGH